MTRIRPMLNRNPSNLKSQTSNLKPQISNLKSIKDEHIQKNYNNISYYCFFSKLQKKCRVCKRRNQNYGE